MSDSPRRSGRSRKVNTKYAGEAWGKETLRLLRESSESSNPTSIDTNEEPPDKDAEFDEKELQEVLPEAEEGEENLSVMSGSSKSSPVGTLRGGDDAIDGQMELLGSEDEGGIPIRKLRWKPPPELHSRGLSQIDRGKSVKESLWRALHGPEVEDLYPLLKAKERWVMHGRDVTLPSFTTMKEARLKDWTKPAGRQASHDDETSLPAECIRRQKLQKMSVEEARRRKFIVDAERHKIVLGSWSNQQSYEVPHLKSMQIKEAWRIDPSIEGTSYHSGWLLNVGERIQGLVWSNAHDHEQYLAVVCRSTPDQREQALKVETPTSPAFTPSARYPLGIQIWKFAVESAEKDGSRIDHSVPPRITQLLACSFGDFKQISWASAAASLNLPQPEASLGILVCLTTDGHIRLIRVPKNDSNPEEPTCAEVISPMFDLNPPDNTIFTCFTFASPTDLITGTSSGHLHLYNITDIASFDNPNPYLTIQTHHTYIMSMCTLGQSTHSHFIVTTTASGAIQLLDLRSPAQDIITIPRARIPTRNLIFSPHTRGFITSIDSSGNTEPRGNAQTTLVSHHFRHFYSTTTLSKFPEGSGTASALAGSQLHPHILVGNTGGTVHAQNVVRRILPTSRSKDANEHGSWVQKLIEYEWIPDTTQTSPPERQFDFYHGPPIRRGTSRLSLGFRPEKLDLSNVGSKKRKASASAGLGRVSAVHVIYEEEQAVTAVDWNPNPGVASWAAVGWGSGIVMVADWGHDAE